jgi:hypothetical protein
MKGHQPQSPVAVQRAFAPTRLSDDLLAQAYEHVLQMAQQVTTDGQAPAPRPTRSRKRAPRVATTGGRES